MDEKYIKLIDLMIDMMSELGSNNLELEYEDEDGKDMIFRCTLKEKLND